jgi:homoserine O-acetyltransferase
MTTATTLDRFTGLFHLPLSFGLQHGGELLGAQLGFELWGVDDGPVVLVLGGISSGRHVARWRPDGEPGFWDPLVGPGRAIDPTRVQVLGVDYLGGDGVSTGPAHGTRTGVEFPSITPTDQARAIQLLLEHLGVSRLRCAIGASYGAMVVLGLGSLMSPPNAEHLVAISGAHQSHPLATGWRTIQRRIIRLGLRHGSVREAVALARALAMTTYRSPEEFQARFDAPPQHCGGEWRFAIEDYLLARAGSGAGAFDPRAYLSLSESLDLHQLDPGTVRVPTTLVGATTDRLVPIAQLRELASRLGAPVTLHELDSPFGHDAFLKEWEALDRILRGALAVAEEVTP